MQRALAAMMLVLTAACGNGRTSTASVGQLAAVSGEGLYYVRLASSDAKSFTLSFDKQLLGNGGSSSTHDLASHIIVRASGFNADDQVRVVVINYVVDDAGSSRQVDEQEIDLSYGGNHRFQGRLDHAIAIRGYNEGRQTAFRQEIAVAVNGQWQLDPINGTHNFQVDMSRAARAR